MAKRRKKPYGCGIMFKRMQTVNWLSSVVGTRYTHTDKIIMMDSQSCDCANCNKVLVLLAQHVNNGNKIVNIDELEPDCMYRVRLEDLTVNARNGDIRHINFDFIRIV